MTYAVASRYANLFEIVSDPYAIVILHHLFEVHQPVLVEDLVKESKTTEGKVRAICEGLRRMNILDKDSTDEGDTYSATNNSMANTAEEIFKRIN